jgi:hypothetical protein
MSSNTLAVRASNVKSAVAWGSLKIWSTGRPLPGGAGGAGGESGGTGLRTPDSTRSDREPPSPEPGFAPVS